MSDANQLNRRSALGRCGKVAAAACAFGAGAELSPAEETKGKASNTEKGMPYGTIGKVKISRLLLGGNLVGGYMHARDLRYVTRLFRAYVTEEKILETFKLAEEHGINTVLESGARFVQKYNDQCGGQMQIIPSIHPSVGLPAGKLADEIKKKVDAGCAALYVWGVAADRLVQAGAVGEIGKAVELAKTHDIPVGVGGHSLEVPVACEKHGVPCDFYVKTLHKDTYPSAIAPDLRKEYIWLDGGPGWYDNMWCINPQETIEFMRGVKKPWIAFKVLAAGAIQPRQGFAHALEGGADFLGVGMFDFQIKENCELMGRLVRRAESRPRPWMA